MRTVILVLLTASCLLATELQEIAVVRTWQELMHRPSIPLPGGGSAHLGIEATRMPRMQALALYCLTDGYRLAAQRTIEDDQRPLGPFLVAVRRRGEQGVCVTGLMRQDIAFEETAERCCLFRIPILLPSAGSYEVSVRIADGPVLARATVEAGAEAIHHWTDLWCSDVESEAEEAVEDAPSLSRLQVGGGPMVPTWDGMVPTLLPDDPAFDPHATLLPRIMPQQVGGLQLRRDGDHLLLESPWPMAVGWLAERLLVRFWVNGEPRQPIEHELCELSGGGVDCEDGRIALILDHVETALQAGPRDRIELQLLYCEQGCEYIGDGLIEQLEATIISIDDDRPPHRLSPRIVWQEP